jgi:SAM-dependent methyltransferase
MKPVGRWFAYRAARFLYNFARSADFRSVMLLQWRKPSNLFQPFNETSLDRYPEIFRFARDQIGDSAAHRILSFGCATGEEVFSLRQYFPLASIRGLDINPRSIALARRRLKSIGDERISFGVHASAVDEMAPYDAIFCMAVFRHGGLGESGINNRCDHLIRFEDFERTVDEIARCIKPHGLLFIANCNFRFSDTAASKDFEIVWRDNSAADAHSPIFGPDNRFLPGTSYDEIGFRRRD